MYQPKFGPHLVGKACENSIPYVLIPHFLSVKWLVRWWYHPENCHPVGHFPMWDCNVFRRGDIMYPIRIQILFNRVELCIILDEPILGMLDRVLLRMDSGFILFCVKYSVMLGKGIWFVFFTNGYELSSVLHMHRRLSFWHRQDPSRT
jgi:hypothetical protein